jgi:peptidoglycan/LPS O-acetylase OafA/YrhL
LERVNSEDRGRSGTAPTGGETRRRPRSNGFDLVRLVAAVAVIVGHSYPLTGHATPGFLGSHMGTIAVKAFFITSGFLIARSWLSEPDILAFARKRLLRIMPALIVVVLLTLLVLGPLVSQLGPWAYFHKHGAFHYLWNILMFPIYDLPGVFEHNTYPIAVNGSLWSLPAEMFMYILTPLILVGRGRRSRHVVVFCAAVFVAVDLYYTRIIHPAPLVVIYGTSLASFLEVAPYFIIGMVYAAFDLNRFARPITGLALLVLAAFSVNNFILNEVVLLVLLPFVVISIGTMNFRSLDFILDKGDFSYGLYLYGFPVQQSVAFLIAGAALYPYVNAIIALPVAFILAMLSWHLVEKRALAFKSTAKGDERLGGREGLRRNGWRGIYRKLNFKRAA